MTRAEHFYLTTTAVSFLAGQVRCFFSRFCRLMLVSVLCVIRPALTTPNPHNNHYPYNRVRTSSWAPAARCWP